MRFKISTKDDLKQYITVYGQLTKNQLEAIKDILPNPGYHDKGYFHLGEDPIEHPHYHILMDHIPTKDDVKEIKRRLENAH